MGLKRPYFVWLALANKNGAILCATKAACSVMRRRGWLKAEHPSSTALCQALSGSAATFPLKQPWPIGFFRLSCLP